MGGLVGRGKAQTIQGQLVPPLRTMPPKITESITTWGQSADAHEAKRRAPRSSGKTRLCRPWSMQETFEELTGLDDLSKAHSDVARAEQGSSRARRRATRRPAEVDRTAGDAAEAAKESDRMQQEANTSARTAADGRIEWEATRDRARDLQQTERAARVSREAVVAAEALVSDAEKDLTAARQHIRDFGGDPDGKPHQYMTEAQDHCSNLEKTAADLTRRGAELKSAVAQDLSSRATAEQAHVVHQNLDTAVLATAVESAEAAVLQARIAYEEAQRTATVADAGRPTNRRDHNVDRRRCRILPDLPTRSTTSLR